MEMIIDRIVALMKEKRMYDTEVFRQVGIPSSTWANYKARHTNPPAEYLPQIADILGVSLEYLIKGDDTNSIAKDYNEQVLIDSYRQLPEDIKLKILGEIQVELMKAKRSEKSEKVS